MYHQFRSTPICFENAADLPNNEDIMKLMESSETANNQDPDGLVNVHVVGHSWIEVLKKNATKSPKYGFRLTGQFFGDENTFDTIIAKANTGIFKNHDRLVVFGIIPMCWTLQSSSLSPSLRLLVPNSSFGFNDVHEKMIQLSNAIKKFNPNTKIIVFLPPVINVNKYNSALIAEAGQNYSVVVKSAPQIDPDNITFHLRHVMSELHPSKFKKNPIPNCSPLFGHSAAIDFSWNIKNNIMNYIKKVSNELSLDDIFPDGLKPNDAFAKEIIANIGDAYDLDLRKDLEVPDTIENTFSAPLVNTGINIPTKNVDSSVPFKSGNSQTNNVYSGGSENMDIDDNQPDDTAKTYYDSALNDEAVYGDSELIEATVEEVSRLCKHIQTVRDTCFPNVSNSELCKIAIHTLQKCLQ